MTRRNNFHTIHPIGRTIKSMIRNSQNRGRYRVVFIRRSDTEILFHGQGAVGTRVLLVLFKPIRIYPMQ